MKRILLIFLILARTITAFSQTADDYDVIINKFQRYYNEDKPDSIFNMFSVNLQLRLPLNKTTEKISLLRSRLGDLVAFNLAFQKDGVTFYATAFNTSTLTLMVTINKDYKFETFRLSNYISDTSLREKSNFFLKTATGNLYGTLVEPSNIHKVPVVLIIPGPGQTDRNGNNPFGVKANTYSMIADSLLKEGYASLRYDKRGVGSSAAALKNEEDLSFDDMINDAVGFIKLLKQHWHFSKVIILGHSEGSLIGMKVAEQEKVDGYISVSGVAQRADKIIEKQIRTQSKELSKKATVVFDSLMNGYTVNNKDSALRSMFDNSAQGYLRSWMKYNPKEEISKLTIPVLILQGTTDLQVNIKEAKKLKKACHQATLTIIDGMNYMLKQAPEDRTQNEATYVNPNLPLSPGLMSAIINFIREIK